MKAVVDASVAVKWLFTEDGTVEARRLLAHRIMLHAPDFILIEAANVVWKKARRREVADAQSYLQELARLGDLVALAPAADLVTHAAAIALRIDHPVYDCLYLACAEVEEAPLVTADRRLRDAARDWPGAEVWLISDPETAGRVASAATGLVIQETTVRELTAAYTVFSDTADHVVGRLPHRDPGILSPEHRDAYLKTPAFLRLVTLIGNLSYEERIDLMALAWFGRDVIDPSPWSYFLDRAYRMGIDDPRYEVGLGRYWQPGLDRLRGKTPNIA